MLYKTFVAFLKCLQGFQSDDLSMHTLILEKESPLDQIWRIMKMSYHRNAMLCKELLNLLCVPEDCRGGGINRFLSNVLVIYTVLHLADVSTLSNSKLG